MTENIRKTTENISLYFFVSYTIRFAANRKNKEKNVSTVRKTNVANARTGPNLKRLSYSHDKNPLLEVGSITVKRRHVRTGLHQELTDLATGEVRGVATIHEIIEKDDAEFVKIFADGVKAAFALSRTAARVFQLVLEQYQAEPMVGGYADSVYLAWFDGGLSGAEVGMSDRTFQTGLRELLGKRFLAPRAPNVYWVNPSLFFKGNRVLFVREYVRKQKKAETGIQVQPDLLEDI